MLPRRSRTGTLIPQATALLVAAAIGLPASAERLLVRTYTAADGLATGQISSLVTDREGFLWVCARGGLSRFDGSTFTVFPARAGLPHPRVNHLLQTVDGNRWVATNGGGVARLEREPEEETGRIFTPFPVGTTDRTMHVNVLFEARDGALLAGTDGGLYRASPGDGEPRFEPVPLAVPETPDGALQIWSMTAGSAGDLWLGTSSGLVRRRADGGTERVAVKPLQGADNVSSVLLDEAGRLWLGHELGLVVWMPPPPSEGRSPRGLGPPLLDRAPPCVEAGGDRNPVALPTAPGEACHWAPPAASRGLDGLVRPELRTADGTIWLTYRYGLVSFDGDRFRIFAEPEAAPSWTATTLAADPGGDLWVRSRQGLARVARRGFVHYTTADGLAEPGVERVFRGPDGRVFAVTSSSRIHRFDGSRWTAVRPNVPADVGRGGRSRYGAVLVDHRGEWWVGSGDGLYRFPRVTELESLERVSPRARYTTADGLAGNDVANLYEDSRGDLWIAVRVPTGAPLARWSRATGVIRRFGSEAGLPALQEVWAFAEDRAGGLWVSGAAGLFRFDGDRFHRFAIGGDWPSGGLGRWIQVDDEGRLWATAGDVPTRIEDPTAESPRVSTYPHARDLAAGRFGALTADADGGVYLRSARGLARLGPGGTYQELGTGEPFDTTRNAFRDSDGALWFATADGILRYRPLPRKPPQPPPVWISGVRVAGVARPVPPMGAASLDLRRLTPEERQVEIEYSGLGFGPAEPLRFQVRLDGVDREWSEPTERRSILYAGLGAGQYRFRVRAVDATGELSPRPASLAFTLPPPVWRRPWFVSLSGLVVLGLVASAYRARVRRLVHLERVRTRIAADLHDDLGASLARVSLLAEAARRKLREGPKAAEPLLGEIGETARGLVLAAGDIAYSIDPGRGRLDGLVARLRRFTEELLDGTGIAWHLELEGNVYGVELSSDQRRHLLAILKEGVHNAVRHGRPRRLDLALAVRRGSLSAELVDDGRGFAAGVPGDGEEPPGGHGLRSMRHRAGELGGRLRIDSAPGTGTRLRLDVPL